MRQNFSALKQIFLIGTRSILSFLITLSIFTYATWGDFTWLTLSGPLAVFPDLEAEEARFVTTPAGRSLIAYFVFALTFFFFFSIKNLLFFLNKHKFFLIYVSGAVLFLTIALAGNIEDVYYQPTSIRIALLLCSAVLLISCYDLEKHRFFLPKVLENKKTYFRFLTLLFILTCLIEYFIPDLHILKSSEIEATCLRFAVLVSAALFARSSALSGSCMLIKALSFLGYVYYL